MNQSEIEENTSNKHLATIGFGLYLIGQKKSCATIFNQSYGVKKPNQSKNNITFYTELKTALVEVRRGIRL